jgi:hypothetical protein
LFFNKKNKHFLKKNSIGGGVQKPQQKRGATENPKE